MSKYRGKWVSKTESEDTGISMVDVIEVEGNEVKAVGRNFTLTELLANYIPIEQSSIKVADPFALADPNVFGSEIDASIEDEVVDKNHISFIKPVSDMMNDTFTIMPKSEEVKVESAKSKYTEDEQLVVNMINVIVNRKPEEFTLKLEVDSILDFNLSKFIDGSEMLGLDEDLVYSTISKYIVDRLTTEQLEKMVKASLLKM